MSKYLPQLQQFLSSFSELNAKEWAYISQNVQLLDFEKKSYLSQIGDKIEHIDYIIEGSVRMYFVTDDKRDISINFSFSNQLIHDFCLSSKSKISEFHVQALTPTKVFRLAEKHHIYLNKTFDTYQKRRTAMLGKELSDKMKREKNLLSLNAEQNYLKVCADSPEIIRFIPVKDIASYLGIHPESLSRIRKNMA